MRLLLLSVSLVATAAITIPRHEVTAPREVEIVGLDYAFRLPSTLPPGLTTFRFVNKGMHGHEFNVVLLKESATLADYMAAWNGGKPVDPAIDATIGVLFADSGLSSASHLTTDLLPGRTYAVICIFRDTSNAPRHLAMGMFGQIKVASAKKPTEPALRVDTIVGMDYAFRAPATLPPGTHYFAFVNSGKQRHEVSMELLKQGATLQQLVETQRKGGNVGELLEDALGVLHSLGGTTPRGLLRVDMLPGRNYLLVCQFRDSTNAPPHHTLGMFGAISVDAAAKR